MMFASRNSLSRAIFDNAAVGIAVVNLDGSWRYVNARLCEMIGYSREELFQIPFPNITHPDDLEVDLAQFELQVCGQIRMYTMEKRYICKDGSVIWVNLTTNTQFDEEKNPLHCIAIIEEITERKQTERALEQMQKLESLGLLAGGIAHDFNNMFAAINSHLTLALRGMSPNDLAWENVQAVGDIVERAAALINKLLVSTGQSYYEVQSLDLNDLVEECLRLLNSAAWERVAFRPLLHVEPIFVRANPSQIYQVVTNLLINAAEAIQAETGTVTVRTWTEWLDATDKHYWQYTGVSANPGEYAIVEVSDTGVGIDEQALSKIFDPFFTSKPTGRGLGLAIVRGIVRGHKGGLTVETEKGEGTSFCIALPCNSTPDKEWVTKKELYPKDNHANVVLVIEDEEPMRTFISQVVEQEGFSVLTAKDGKEGLALYEEQVKDICLVILDLILPEISGERVFTTLRQVNPAVNVIVSSGGSPTLNMQRFIEEMHCSFLLKPYSADVLSREIEKFAI